MLKEMMKNLKQRGLSFLIKLCLAIPMFIVAFHGANLVSQLMLTDTTLSDWVRYVEEKGYWPTDLFAISVKGDSMNPGFVNEETYIADGTDRAKRSIQRGDVLALFVQPYVDENTKTGPGDLIILKRVIGIGGDKINIDLKGISVNGELLNEDYVSEFEWKEGLFRIVLANSNSLFNGSSVEIEVPKNHVFVLGDNRAFSLDSRSLPYRFLNIETQVFGRVIH